VFDSLDEIRKHRGRPSDSPCARPSFRSHNSSFGSRVLGTVYCSCDPRMTMLLRSGGSVRRETIIIFERLPALISNDSFGRRYGFSTGKLFSKLRWSLFVGD